MRPPPAPRIAPPRRTRSRALAPPRALALAAATACALLAPDLRSIDARGGPALAEEARAPGPLVVAGGGPTVPEVAARALALAGGTGTARVLVVAQASAAAGAGDASVAFWREAGAGAADRLDLGDRDAAIAAVRAASLIWMPGGDQGRLVRALEGAGVIEAIRERRRAGAVVGGTSAGAAALSAVMLTGEADLESLTAGRTVTATGLGLWPGAIVDQHLLARRRLPRLLAAVMDHPRLLGVGVDEATAAFLLGDRIEVLGRGQVVVVDARGASDVTARPGAPLAAKDLRVHVLTSGMGLDLGR